MRFYCGTTQMQLPKLYNYNGGEIIKSDRVKYRSSVSFHFHKITETTAASVKITKLLDPKR